MSQTSRRWNRRDALIGLEEVGTLTSADLIAPLDGAIESVWRNKINAKNPKKSRQCLVSAEAKRRHFGPLENAGDSDH
jgi:hypothetical protein